MNNTPAGVIEIFLQPGEWYFGDHQVRIRTLLGSCVAMVFWHPKRLLGGMCHFMLPAAGPRKTVGAEQVQQPLSGRYADEAMSLLMQEMHKSGSPHYEYQAKLFGGGDMFATTSQLSGVQIGQRNVEAARSLIRDQGFNCVAEHLGGQGHRNVIFDIWSGHVWMRQQGRSSSPANMSSTLLRRGLPSEADMLVTDKAQSSLHSRRNIIPLNSRAIRSVRTAGEVGE